ncbi:DUF1902 domain-containing protein [Nostoc sp.]
MMAQITFKVEAFWDSDAEVWVATSDDVPGLVIEASTIEVLTKNTANGVLKQAGLPKAF